MRALECVGGEWVANDILCCPSLELFDELVVDTLLDVDPGAGTAALAVVEENTEVDPGDGVLNVCIVEDDVGALATKLKGDLLQVGASSSLHDLTADNSATSEGDLVDVHVRGDGSTGDLAEAGDDVDDTWWETSLLDELAGEESTKWCLFSRLEDDGVTAGNGGADLPRKHEEGEVPWDDLTADTDLCTH